MADPIKWKSKIILAKVEATYATDPTPTGVANAILMTDVEYRPMEGQDVNRNLELAYLGAQEEFPTGLYATLTGSVELVGSGTAGTAPAWGPLLRACGVAEVASVGVDVEYTPITDAHESVTTYFWLGPTLHIAKGVRGTAVITLNAQGIPVARFTLMGLFATPADAARAVPDLDAFQVPQIATHANTPVFTIGGTAMVLRELTFNLGCDVQPRLLIGRETMPIVDKQESISARVEALPLATFNPFALAQARTRQALVLTHGTVAGKITTINAPNCVHKRMTGYENSQNVAEWPLQLTPLPDAGDDQWTITLT